MENVRNLIEAALEAAMQQRYVEALNLAPLQGMKSRIALEYHWF
ncbi:hypothetical protein QUA74_11170 [Microcoleus sp. LAD1_D3]